MHIDKPGKIEKLANQKKPEGGLRTLGSTKSSLPDTPLITIITVVLNGAMYLDQALCSVLGQSYGNIEYIIIDGCSTDGSLDIIRKHETQVDYWTSEADNGIYDAMNKGLHLARGELIAFLNADDYYEVDGISSVANAYLSHRIPGIYFGHTYLIQDDMGLRYQYRARTDHSRGMGFCHPAMFAHREIYQQLGEYDTRYRLAADYDFVLRALDQNVSFIPIDVFLVNYRNTGLSARNLARSLGEIKTINKKHFGVFSFAHGRFITSYIKTLLLISLQPIIKSIAGDKFLTKLKLLYTRIFLSKNREV